MCVSIGACKQKYTYTNLKCAKVKRVMVPKCGTLCVCACVCACVYVCACVCVCTRVHEHVCVCKQEYTYMKLKCSRGQVCCGAKVWYTVCVCVWKKEYTQVHTGVGEIVSAVPTIDSKRNANI